MYGIDFCLSECFLMRILPALLCRRLIFLLFCTILIPSRLLQLGPHLNSLSNLAKADLLNCFISCFLLIGGFRGLLLPAPQLLNHYILCSSETTFLLGLLGMPLPDCLRHGSRPSDDLVVILGHLI